MAAKKEVSKKTAVIIIVIVVIIAVIVGYMAFFHREKVQPVAGKPQEFMPPEMKAKVQEMGGGGILTGEQPTKSAPTR
jgi:flagellar basal body-associated protein FliL